MDPKENAVTNIKMSEIKGRISSKKAPTKTSKLGATQNDKVKSIGTSSELNSTLINIGRFSLDEFLKN